MHKKISKKNLCGNLYMANIVYFYSFLIQVEIKKKYYYKCCLSPSNGPKQHFKPHPTRWHYPIITYLTTEGKLSFVRNRKLAVIPGKLSRANKWDIFAIAIMKQPTIKKGLRNTCGCDAVFSLASMGKINVLTNKS